MNLRPFACILLLSPCLQAVPRDEGGPSKEGWSFKAGAAFFTGPAAPGADERRSMALPLVGAEYNGRYFLGVSRAAVGAGVGVHLLNTKEASWDVDIAWSQGRLEKRAPILAGMGDQTSRLWLGTSYFHQFGPVRAGVSAAHGLSSEVGNRAGLHLESLLRLAPRWMAGLSASMAFGDAKNLAYDFGITPEQADKRKDLITDGDTRLAAGKGAFPYRPKGGARSADLGVNLVHVINAKWSVLILVKGTRLLADAAASPLAPNRDALSGGAGFSVSF